MKEAELAPLKTDRTTVEGEDWWEDDDERNHIVQTQARWQDEQDEDKSPCCRPWWIGLAIAVLVVVGQVLFLSLTNNTTDAPSPRSGRTVAVKGDRTGGIYYFTAQGQQQVDQYRRDKALILNVHITHHGGTTFCGLVGRAVGAPSFACMGVRPKDNVTADDFSKHYPWSHNATSQKIEHALPYFGMLSWEFGHNKARPLAETNWEEPNLVSVLIMRHPIERSLAHSRFMHDNYPGIMNGTANKKEWWKFYKETREDNFALSMLTYREQGHEKVTEKHLDAAKNLVRRFTFVLDLACLGESIAALADVLGITPTEESPQTKPHPPPRERVPFPDVYEYLEKRNFFDIQLYEWSKSLSLVRCDELSRL